MGEKVFPLRGKIFALREMTFPTYLRTDEHLCNNNVTYANVFTSNTDILEWMLNELALARDLGAQPNWGGLEGQKPSRKVLT